MAEASIISSTPVSPWTYLGHDRFVAHRATARRDGRACKPMDLGEVFPVSGGLPLPKRAPQRQAYRLVELARWREYLGHAAQSPAEVLRCAGDLAAHWILGRAANRDDAQALALAGALGCARSGPRSATSPTPPRSRRSPRECGLDADRAGRPAPAAPEIAARVRRLHAGSDRPRRCSARRPTSYGDELFWGQDRLDFLDRKLAQ